MRWVTMAKPYQGDPIYKSKAWKRVQAYWQDKAAHEQLHCEAPICLSRHGTGIETGNGAWSLDAGHIVGVHEARAMGWTDLEICALSNSRPEHRRCNRTAGAVYGNRVRGRQPRPNPLTSRAW